MSKSSPLIGKRRRGGDDEVFFDNYHAHKRYLTEVMASSMIGLSVGESAASRPPLAEVSLSSAQTETGGTGVSKSASSFPSHGDDTSTLDSPMSEDSDESVGYRLIRGTEAAQCSAPPSFDLVSVNPTTPCSARKFQRLPCHTPGHFQPGPLPCRMHTSASPYAPSAWPRCPDSEGRLPPSPNDPCQSADLRRATLLRNLQLRAQQPAQPDCSATTPDARKSPDNADEQESVEEAGDQSSPNSIGYKVYDQGEQIRLDANQVGCMGSPSPCVFSNQVVRGSPRVRSLLLGVDAARPKAAQIEITKVLTSSQAGDEELSKAQQKQEPTSRTEEERSFKRSRSPRCPKSPTSPRSPQAVVSSFEGYDVSSPKDGNVSDTESTFTRRSAHRTSLSRNPSVCSREQFVSRRDKETGSCSKIGPAGNDFHSCL
ncbi:hypothetical protein R1flu_002107 [Riccia fluitans]|uniref:Uncharacterized protein n=1 Tax=Riccia fluitans TaxID=41844 RepID=A0ABD1Y8I8_9MARC